MSENCVINNIVSSLTLKQKLLELLMLDIRFFAKDICDNPPSVAKLPLQIAELLSDYPLGGVILFRENLQNLDEVIQLTNDLQQHTQFGRLIATDQEGGTVTRIYNASEMPGNMALGAIDDILITKQSSQIMGSELKALGINFAFAPVLDVNSNPKNPIVGVRSFGSDAHLVARHGIAYCNGLKQENIISCGKHFPGHGDTASDSHHALPIIDRPLAEFNLVDLVPFEAAIAESIDSIMTAHIVVPNLDDSHILSKKTQTYIPTPATLSKPILTTLLREKMGYKGVVASDALDMKAISDNFDPVEATVRCIEAGVDLVLMPFRIWSEQAIADFKQYFEQVENICASSPTLISRINESCTRILTLKFEKNLTAVKYQVDLTPQVQNMHTTVLSKQHKEFQECVAARAVTLQKNEELVLPWKSNFDDKILVIALNDVIISDAIHALKNLGYNHVTTKLYPEVSLLDINHVDKILLLTYNLVAADELINKLVCQLNNVVKPYVMISCHTPYDIEYVVDAKTNILAFGSSGVDQTNYSVRKFALNLAQAINKIMTATSVDEFNHNVPVQLMGK